jgi:hypothetical protein
MWGRTPEHEGRRHPPTTTEVIKMNSTTRSRIVSALTVVAVTSIATAAPAMASQPREPRGAGTTTPSAYAEPLAALAGRTLAQYLADHQAGDRRLG